MKLLTKEIIKKLPKLYATDGKKVRDIIVKFFNPVGAGTWYIVEYDGENIFFGYCDLGLGFPEWGYVSLKELESIKLPYGLKIERDLYFNNKQIDIDGNITTKE